MRKSKKEGFLHRLSIRLIGDQQKYPFEHRFLNAISFGVGTTSLLGFLVNIFIGLGIIEILTTLGASLVFYSLYILSRVYSKMKFAMWFGILFSYLLLSFLWIKSAGSNGPIPYAFFLLFLSVALLTNKSQRNILLVVLAIDVILLFYLEHRYPESLVYYSSESARTIDMVLSVSLYFTLGGIIIIHAKNNYVKEKLNAEKSDKLKSAFLANMSHEIRTPMNSIVGFTGLLKNRNLPVTKRKRYLQIVEESAAYLLRLIDDILDISKIEADELIIDIHRIHLNELMISLKFSEERLLSKAKKEKVKFSFENNNQDSYIYSDSIRIAQILSNLISNAIKYTEEGYIKFGYYDNKNDILFYVKDSGIGIKEENIPNIFDRFTKLDNCTNIAYRGTGIGLSIAKKMVELLKGKIWVDSVPNQGSSFYFSIPHNSEKADIS